MIRLLVVLILFLYNNETLKEKNDVDATRYYVIKRCFVSHTIKKHKYHKGYNPTNGKIEWNFSDVYMDICDYYTYDTIFIDRIEKNHN